VDTAGAISVDANGKKVDVDTAEVILVDADGKEANPKTGDTISADAISTDPGNVATAAEDHGIRMKMKINNNLQTQTLACETIRGRAAARFEVFNKLRQFQNQCKFC